MASARGSVLIFASMQVAVDVGGIAAGGARVAKDRSDTANVVTLLQADADAIVTTAAAVPAGAPAIGAKTFLSGQAINMANEAADPSTVWVVRGYVTTPDGGATVFALLQNAENPQKWIAANSAGGLVPAA